MRDSGNKKLYPKLGSGESKTSKTSPMKNRPIFISIAEKLPLIFIDIESVTEDTH